MSPRLCLGSFYAAGGAAACVVFASAVAQAQQATVGASTETGVRAAGTGVMAEPVGDSDHERFVGSFAVGYMGSSMIPFANATAGATVTPSGAAGQGVEATPVTVYAPAVGLRFWLNETLGIDFGVGMRMFSGNVERKLAQPLTAGGIALQKWETDKINETGFLIHAGVPIALNAEKHYVFELIPEANVGFASGESKWQPYPNPNTVGVAQPTFSKVSLSGFRFDIGVRVGAELHFGFIDVPNLALQAGVGLYYSRESYSAEGSSYTDPANPTNNRPKTKHQDSSNTFSTSVNGEPWAVFTNNISALYYF